jgi:hypothetical protein
MLLCSAHHARVHEGGIRIVKDAQGRWRFRTPDGRAIPERGYRPQVIEAEDPSAEGWHDGVMHGTSVEAAHPSAQESRGTVG